MPIASIFLDGSGKFEDWKERMVHHLGNDAPPIRFARLPGGMAGGKSSVMIGLEIPDGSVVMAETSMALFMSVASAFSGAEARNHPEIGQWNIVMERRAHDTIAVVGFPGIEGEVPLDLLMVSGKTAPQALRALADELERVKAAAERNSDG